jgi:hypothetical protein
MPWVGQLLLFLASVRASELTRQIAESGRVVEMVESPSERLSPPVLIAPGAPPTLSFRYFDSSERGRYANLGLVIDDAGH